MQESTTFNIEFNDIFGNRWCVDLTVTGVSVVNAVFVLNQLKPIIAGLQGTTPDVSWIRLNLLDPDYPKGGGKTIRLQSLCSHNPNSFSQN
jgi:hypothetical protein